MRARSRNLICAAVLLSAAFPLPNCASPIIVAERADAGGEPEVFGQVDASAELDSAPPNLGDPVVDGG